MPIIPHTQRQNDVRSFATCSTSPVQTGRTRLLQSLLLLILLLSATVSLAAVDITPPMNLVPDKGLVAKNQAGYRSQAVTSIAIAPDGTIGTVGRFESYRGQGGPFMFFHKPDFTPSDRYQFAPNPALDDAPSEIIVALRDGSFLFTDYQKGIGTHGVWRITPDGSRSRVNNASWGRFTNIFDMVQHPDDDNAVYVVMTGNKVIKFDLASGNRDTGFAWNSSLKPGKIAFSPDKQLMVSWGSNKLETIDPDTGSTLRTLTIGSSFRQFAFQSDGKIIVTGREMNVRNAARSKTWNYIVRLNRDGSVDDSFFEHKHIRYLNKTGYAGQVAVNDRDEIYFSGSFSHLTGKDISLGGVAKLNPDGSLNTEFAKNLYNIGNEVSANMGASDIEIQSDGKVLLSGRFHGYNNLYHGGLVRIHGNGKLDTPINNTRANLSVTTGLAAGDAAIVAAATQPARTTPEPGLTVFVGNSRALHYGLGEEDQYNEPGYHPDYYGTTTGNTGIITPEFKPVGDRFILSGWGGIKVYNTDGTLAWSHVPAGFAEKFFYDASAHVGRGLFAINRYSSNSIELFDIEDGSRPPVSRIAARGLTSSFNARGDYLYVLGKTTLYRHDMTNPANFNRVAATIRLPEVYGRHFKGKVEFYTDTDFYVVENLTIGVQRIIKLQLVNSRGEPDPDGTQAVVDTSFGTRKTPGTVTIRKAGIYWVASDKGELFFAGLRTGSGGLTENLNSNIIRVGATGYDVQTDYILSTSIAGKGRGGSRAGLILSSNILGLGWGKGKGYVEIVDRDYSDAPSSTTRYGDASHGINNAIRLGDGVTIETEAYDSPDAGGDGMDDGVSFPPLLQGQTATIDVAVSQTAANAAYLQAWIDMNGDGDFDDPGEQIAQDVQYAGGSTGIINLSAPISSVGSEMITFARFRWSTTPGLASSGDADTGEVEDYQVTLLMPCDAFTGDVNAGLVSSLALNTGEKHFLATTTVAFGEREGHLHAHPVTPTGTIADTAEWDAASAMTVEKRKSRLYSTDASGRLTEFVQLDKAAFGSGDSSTVMKYTFDPSHDNGRYLAGRKSGSLLGPISPDSGLALINNMRDMLRYLNEPGYRDYYSKTVAKRSDKAGSSHPARVIVSSDDGFLYAFDQSNGALGWGWMPRSLVAKLESHHTFQNKHYQQGIVDVLDAKDANDQYATYVVGSYRQGLGQYVLKLNNNSGLAAVIRDTDHSEDIGMSESPNNGQRRYFTDAGGRVYAAYIIGDGNSDYRLHIRSITDNKVQHVVPLSFKATSTAYITPNYPSAGAPDANVLYIGADNGAIYSADLLTGDGELRTASAIQSEINSNSVLTMDTVDSSAVTFIGTVQSVKTGLFYLRAQSADRLTVFTYVYNAKKAAYLWDKAWSVSTSGGSVWNGSGWTSSGSIPALASGATITAEATVLSDGIVLPVSHPPAGTACYGTAHYYFYELSSGEFPKKRFFNYSTKAAFTNVLDLGYGVPRKLEVRNLLNADKMVGIGVAEQTLSKGVGASSQFYVNDSLMTGIRGWREVR